jgi:hypothetical protein
MAFGRSDAGLESAFSRSRLRGSTHAHTLAFATRCFGDHLLAFPLQRRCRRTAASVSSIPPYRSLHAAMVLPSPSEFSPSYRKPGTGMPARRHCRRSPQEIKYCFGTPAKRRASAIPRRDAPESCMDPSPRRAWGMPGAQCTRSLACNKKQAHERSHHRSTRITRHSRTQWF